MSGSSIFDPFAIRKNQEDYFFVSNNFFAGLLYFLVMYRFLTSSKWTFTLLASITGLLVLALIALVIHIEQGKEFELKTVGAMVFESFETLRFLALPISGL